jgi:hypothetical protein
VKRGPAPDSTGCYVVGMVWSEWGLKEGLLSDSEYSTHGFVCDELVGEKLDWWMAVARRDQGVLRMRIHELRESRVDEAYIALISAIRNSREAFLYTFSENEAVHYGGHACC